MESLPATGDSSMIVVSFVGRISETDFYNIQSKAIRSRIKIINVARLNSLYMNHMIIHCVIKKTALLVEHFTQIFEY